MSNKRRWSVIFSLILFSIIVTGCTNNSSIESPYLDLKPSEYVELPNEYLSFEYKKPEIIVEDAEISAQLRIVLEGSSTDKENNEGPIKNGDKLFISYTAKDEDGIEVAKSDGYYVIMGKEYLTQEMTDALLGHYVGETVTTRKTISDDFSIDAKLAGKTITYYILIEKKYDTTVPEFNDEWVQNNSDLKTTDEYLNYLKQELYQSKYEDALDDIFSQKWEDILDNSIKKKGFPTDLLEAEKDYFSGYINYNGYANLDLDYEVLADEYAENSVKEKMVLYSIALKEDLIPSNEEFEKYCLEIIAGQGFDENSFKEYFIYEPYDYGLKFGWLEEYLTMKIERIVLGYDKQ